MISVLIFLFGIVIMLYVFFPLISWQIYYNQAYAQQSIAAPIPQTTLVSPQTVGQLFAAAANGVTVDLSDARNWYPTIKQNGKARISSYTISIPKINIFNAVVGTTDDDLAHHLVNFDASEIPPDTGNVIIFGHSTLPQLYDASNYKTIFANAHKLTTGDKIYVTANNITYTYIIQSALIVDPDDTSVLSQNYDASYLTIITCTPPGTTWKRLAIKAKLEKVK